jgi:predicted TIM-barrel fold metal-dependent hydrolase
MKAVSWLHSAVDPLQQPGFKSLLSLAAGGHLFVKISGFYRSSVDHGSAYSDLEDIVRKFANQVPAQLIWASDWPHTGNSKDRKGRDIDLTEPFKHTVLENVRTWVGESVWQKMLVDTASKMFI